MRRDDDSKLVNQFARAFLRKYVRKLGSSRQMACRYRHSPPVRRVIWHRLIIQLESSTKMEEIILNFVNVCVLALEGLFGRHRVRRHQKVIFRNRLSKDGWKWRSFESLRRAIRDDEATTKELLIELGARSSTKMKDVWTLDDHG